MGLRNLPLALVSFHFSQPSREYQETLWEFRNETDIFTSSLQLLENRVGDIFLPRKVFLFLYCLFWNLWTSQVLQCYPYFTSLVSIIFSSFYLYLNWKKSPKRRKVIPRQESCLLSYNDLWNLYSWLKKTLAAWWNLNCIPLRAFSDIGLPPLSRHLCISLLKTPGSKCCFKVILLWNDLAEECMHIYGSP